MTGGEVGREDSKYTLANSNIIKVKTTAELLRETAIGKFIPWTTGVLLSPFDASVNLCAIYFLYQSSALS